MKLNKLKTILNSIFVLLIYINILVAIMVVALMIMKGPIFMKFLGIILLIIDVRLLFEYPRIIKFIRKC